MKPHFSGRPKLEWEDNGVRMTLLEAFSFTDKQGVEWTVPEGTSIDGASIPQMLWSACGSPYRGLYRNASIIHDWFCVCREATPEATHHVFYEAMRVSGVSREQAKQMHWAVQNFGPWWDEEGKDCERPNFRDDDEEENFADW